MGEDRLGRGARLRGRPLSDVSARVVPAVPSFSVDGGFRYAVPPRLADSVVFGSLVRVPLGGRRVRGYVVDVESDADTSGLKEIAAVSGRQPVFDEPLLETLRWAAQHYVSPLSSMLERAAPPNNPPPRPTPAGAPPQVAGSPLVDVVDAVASGRPVRPTVMLSGAAPLPAIVGTATSLLRSGRSTLVVAATTAEAEAIFDHVSAAAPGWAVVAHGDMPAAGLTGAWARATAPAIVVGTPRVAAWPVAGLGAAFVVEDGRRAMKDRQTPTVHARDLLRRRAQVERFALVATGPVPTGEMLATGATVLRGQGRLWPLVEVVDRTKEDTRGNVLTDPAKRALAAVAGRGGRSFVFGHRHGYAAATRCVRCRTVRRCATCGSRPDPGDACSRCGAPLGPCTECGMDRFEPLGAGVGRIAAETGRVVGSDRVAIAPSDGPVVVGTERDVIGMADLDLVVLPDFDGLLFGTDYRAAEDSLRLGARLAGLVGRGSGRRMLVQTSSPDHPMVRALVRADPLPALEEEMAVRATMGYPPSGELMVIETSGGEAPDLGDLGTMCSVLGPAERQDGLRWLLQAPDLTKARSALRGMVQRWRDSGLRVRIDVDPIDL